MTDDDLERQLRERLQARASGVQPRPGGWAAIERRVRPDRRRRLLTVGLPAAAVAAVLVVVGLAVVRSDDTGPRVRTNPALPGDGPAQPSTTERPDQGGGPEVVTTGPGWHLLVGERDGVGSCGQVRPRRERELDASFCGASEKEFDDRGISLAFIDRPPSGAPTTLPPATVAYGFVPVESADVVFTLDRGGEITIPALPFDDDLDAFAGELPAGAAVVKITLWDGDGRMLYEEDLRAAD